MNKNTNIYNEFDKAHSAGYHLDFKFEEGKIISSTDSSIACNPARATYTIHPCHKLEANIYGITLPCGSKGVAVIPWPENDDF